MFCDFRILGSVRWLVVALLFGLGSCLTLPAVPFAVEVEGNLRLDFSASWTEFSSIDGTAVPDGTQILSSDGSTSMEVQGDALSIVNRAGFSLSGVLLENSGTGSVFLYPPVDVQGFGVYIEATESIAVEYTATAYTAGGSFIASITVPSPGTGGEAAYLGLIDPTGAIGILELSSTNSNRFVVAAPQFQVKRVAESDPSNLPVASTETVTVSPAQSYLHEGLIGRKATAATTSAVTDFENIVDLQTLFPSIRVGDYLRLERIGVSFTNRRLNQLLGVFTETEEIEAGAEFDRLPTAIDAGTNFYTDKISGDGAFSTPTNIPEDFIIGASTYLAAPLNTRYLMFSFSEPTVDAPNYSVRMSHIPRQPFIDWAVEFGLHGANLELDSDLDGDGLTLIEEFAFFRDPTIGDSEAGISGTGSGVLPFLAREPLPDFLTVLFEARSDAPLRYRVQTSENLINWDTLPEGDIGVLEVETQEGQAVFFLRTAAGGSRLFARVITEYVPLAP
ncbi:hypothetical protein QEH59_15395 [Coraliomargarita sp. SDUM461004]|uniref:Uncharacterized protein n=1 Tax=Thalassobacterium sedimentorum TaxID=3041258 RepID=A0ABU1AM79_9BACT|nr:hypothetical protein [Coraliomargarita sp. SDUM461004]MDQ8195817.1 hypothetical protein [Coraliomargarita sp. SDUM461004]